MPRVLYTVLDWGLGHATRSVPIIEALLRLETEVILAGSGISLAYLKEVFPGLQTFVLPDKRVKYHTSGAQKGITMRAMAQTRLNRIQHKAVKKAVQAFGITHLISDNVYGAFAKGLSSVLITHQVGPKSPVLEQLVHKQLAKWMSPFQEIWIPDQAGAYSLSGTLSENSFFRGKIKYLGILSRIKPVRTEKTLDLAVLLGGPEPQRGILEAKAIALAEESRLKTVVLRASFAPRIHPESEMVQFIDFAHSETLQEILSKAKLCLARSGYSSVSDLAMVGAKACLIPTPGQPEQEYLAEYLKKNGWFMSATQDKLSQRDLRAAEEYTPPPVTQMDLKEHIGSWLQA
jgi:hypothetical protein